MMSDTREIRIETSTLCPYSCIACPRDRFRRSQTVMPTNLFSSILDKVNSERPDIRIATVSGFGEFATDPAWQEKIALAAGQFDKVHILTTLSLLEINDLDFLLDHVSDIRVSLYGTDETTYKAVHRPPSRITLALIEDRIAYILRQKSPAQRLVLNYLELPVNRHQTQTWIDRWEPQADLIEVWRPHNWIDGREYREPCAHRLRTCGRPEHGPIQVQVDGTVNVCCFDYNGELEIGDLKTQTLLEVFNGTRILAIQAAHRDNRADEIPQCRICDQRDCTECKAVYMVYNSGFTPIQRVGMTSTDYEGLTGGQNDASG